MKDLIVIGAGPAGYPAAIRAAQLGADVLVVDKGERPGGTCLNWGCIPTKTLLHMAEKYHAIQTAGKYGIECSGVDVNWEKMITESRKVVRKLGKGIEGLFKKNNIEYIQDKARIVDTGKIETDSGETFEAKKILIATGARPLSVGGIEPNGNRIMTSREALGLKNRPESLVVIGSGAIGIEFASFYNTFGSEVTVVEMKDRILPVEDEEISEQLKKELMGQGIKIMASTKVKEVSQEEKTVKVETENGEPLKADAALIALGVQPARDNLWSSDLEIKSDDRGWIEVDSEYRTSLEGVYAAGDITGAPWLAHAATHEGIEMVERAFDAHKESTLPEVIPACTFCQPQVGSAGLTEKEALDKYEQVRVGKFPFQALGRTVASDETEGFVKLVFAGKYDQLVGAHVLGAEASELIATLAVSIRMEATPEEIAQTVFAHPTRSEAIHEAALSALERTLHI
jgi:dihydrolipoamide dehydrogenase